MPTGATRPELPGAPDREAAPFTPRAALGMAAWCGLAGGYVDLAAMLLRREISGYYYLQGREFTWTVPLAGLVLLVAPGLCVAAAAWRRPGLVTRRGAAWTFATVALWGPLLRLPILGAASLVLAFGLGRMFSRVIVQCAIRWPRLAMATLLLMATCVTLTGAMWGARLWMTEHRPDAGLPAAPLGARNVLLIVLDTVRSESMSLQGYSRATTPRLARWAERGARFDRAIAPATWSFPSHSTIFTGKWPYQLGTQRRTILDAPFPTLAEHLGSLGYLTAGFVANTTYCGYETRLNRGFVTYDDYVVSPRSFLASSAPGRWIAAKTIDATDAYSRKWTRFQARDASGVNARFLAWLERRAGLKRPFFAFLNYFDAHEPFVLPPVDEGRFGLAPESPKDESYLLDYWQRDKTALGQRDTALARDGYDDCLARLDAKVGDLLDALEHRGVLRDTVVIITSDHGEMFGEHGVYDHGSSLYMGEIHVPLLILGPGVAAGAAIETAVSLRDIPATVLDLAGASIAAGSPFPGRSLAAFWREAGGDGATPASSEGSFPVEPDPKHGKGTNQRGFTTSLVADGHHYLRNGAGVEELFNLDDDPRELRDLRNSTEGSRWLTRFRETLREWLTREPGEPGPEGEYLRRYLERLGPRPRPAS